MASITISSVTPSESLTAGNIIAVVAGSGFRLPTAPPATGVVPVRPPSVRASLGGTACPLVMVLSATEIRIVLPSRGPGAADLLVENIDDAGAAIPGEYKTLASAITYRRPDLSAKGERSTLSRITRAVRKIFADQVIANVSITVHTDYDGDPLDSAGVTEVGALPAVIITGPRALEDRFYSTNETETRTGSDGVITASPPLFTVSPTYTITLLSESLEELHALISLATSAVDMTDELSIARDTEDATAGTVEYEFDFSGAGGFEAANQPNESNIRQATATVIVRGVNIEPPAEVLAGVAGRTKAGIAQTKALADKVPGAGTVTPEDQGRDPEPDVDFTVVQLAP